MSDDQAGALTHPHLLSDVPYGVGAAPAATIAADAACTPDAADRAAVAAVAALGWDGVVLPETRVLGCRVRPVVALDPVAHAGRAAQGWGPQLDEDTLAVWEWPESAGRAPAPALRLVGTLLTPTVTPTAGWRRALVDASRWRAFGASAVWRPSGTQPVAEQDRWEFAVQGVGLVTGPRPPDNQASAAATAPGASAGTAASLELVVSPAVGRRPPARRGTADRWLEELFYRQALGIGLFTS